MADAIEILCGCVCVWPREASKDCVVGGGGGGDPMMGVTTTMTTTTTTTTTTTMEGRGRLTTMVPNSGLGVVADDMAMDAPAWRTGV